MISEYDQQFAAAKQLNIDLFAGTYGSDPVMDAQARVTATDLATLLLEHFRARGQRLTYAVIANQCFMMAALASLALSRRDIAHSVTIGDVRSRRKPNSRTSDAPQRPNPWGYSTTVETLKKEMDLGFRDGSAHAHAWITLSSGQVFDPSIIASDAVHPRNPQRRPPQTSLDTVEALSLAIYLSDGDSIGAYEHKPLLTGYGFHFRALTGPKDPFFHEYRECLDGYSKAQNRRAGCSLF